MYYFYNNTNSERQNAWRNAYEIKLAALEHEKRRFQMGEEISLAKPQVIAKGRRRSGLAAVFKASLLLLSILIS
jgi:hypothetical protein